MNRQRCHIPTFVQVAANQECVLYRAVIRDLSVSGLGLYTSGPLSLGPAMVELPTRLNQALSLAWIQILNVAPVVSGMWRIGAEFSKPLRFPIVTEGDSLRCSDACLMPCDLEGRQAP